MKRAQIRQLNRPTAALLSLAMALVLASGTGWAQISPFGRSGGSLSKDDWAALHAARDEVLAGSASVGARKAWSNPRSGNSGTIVIVDTLGLDGMDCRSVRYEFSLQTKPRDTTYLVHECKTADGGWKLL